MNSIKQSKMALFPVHVEGQEEVRDVLSSTTLPMSIGMSEEVTWEGVELVGKASAKEKMEVLLLVTTASAGSICWN